MCEKISLNLTNAAKHNLALHGHVLEILSVSTWEECFFACLENCQCLSFNFYESSNKTANCELNEASTKIVSAEALKASVGVTYYEPVRKYPGRKVIIQIHQGGAKLATLFKVNILTKFGRYIFNHRASKV